MNMKWSLCSEKFETFEIWAMFTSERPHIVMSRTDAHCAERTYPWPCTEWGLVTKSRRSFFDFTSHEKLNFIFTIFRNTEA
jgi:hypothetical protein